MNAFSAHTKPILHAENLKFPHTLYINYKSGLLLQDQEWRLQQHISMPKEKIYKAIFSHQCSIVDMYWTSMFHLQYINIS